MLRCCVMRVLVLGAPNSPQGSEVGPPYLPSVSKHTLQTGTAPDVPMAGACTCGGQAGGTEGKAMWGAATAQWGNRSAGRACSKAQGLHTPRRGAVRVRARAQQLRATCPTSAAAPAKPQQQHTEGGRRPPNSWDLPSSRATPAGTAPTWPSPLLSSKPCLPSVIPCLLRRWVHPP